MRDMDVKNGRRANQVSFSIYIFMTLLLGGFGVAGIYGFLQSSQPGWAIATGFLMTVHIGLHWLNLRHFAQPRWWLLYYCLQTALIITLTLLPYGQEAIGISFIGSAIITMIAEALGMWGNSRRALWVGLFYGALLFIMLSELISPESLRSYAFAFFVNGGIVFIIFFFLNRESSAREKAEMLAEKLEKANIELAANAARIEELTLVAERQRMARELHDTLAQGVAGLVLRLEAVKAHLGAERHERAAQIVGQSLTRARSTLADSRSAIDDLRADPTSLPAAIRGKVNRFRQATGIPCALELLVDGSSGEENGRLLSEETSRHARHILDEALANITRHAQATEASVRFVVENGKLALTVQDNGRGFDPETAARPGHYGLLGMRERTRLIGGELTIESGEQGTCIYLEAAF